jgi:hypothetical protein
MKGHWGLAFGVGLCCQAAVGAQDAPRPVAAAVGELPVSVSRIRFGLDRVPCGLCPKPAPVAPPPYGGSPTFRVTIVAPRPFMVPIVESLVPGWEPAIPGGRDHKEFMDLVTPPQARPYGAFQNGELLQVAATSMVNALATSAVLHGAKKALAAVRRSKAERIHREVAQELRAVEDAAVREGQKVPPPGPRQPW